MHRLVTRIVPVLAVLFAAGLADADVLTAIPKAERQAVRRSVQADARAHLKSLPYQFERPSVRVPSSRMERLPNGSIKAHAEIRSLGYMGVPGGPKQRIVQKTATYVKAPGTPARNVSGWQQIFYAQPLGQ